MKTREGRKSEGGGKWSHTQINILSQDKEIRQLKSSLIIKIQIHKVKDKEKLCQVNNQKII